MDIEDTRTISLEIEGRATVFGQFHMFVRGDDDRMLGMGADLYQDEIDAALAQGPEGLLRLLRADCDRVQRKVFDRLVEAGARVISEGRPVPEETVREIVASDIPFRQDVKVMIEEPGEAPYDHRIARFVVKAARRLPGAAEDYVRRDVTETVPVSSLVLTEMPKDDLIRTLRDMMSVSAGYHFPLEPIEVVAEADGRHRVMKGNATAMLSVAAGWPSIGATIVEPAPTMAP